MKQPILILGSARGESTTRGFAQQLLGATPHTVIDLREYAVAPYSYQSNYPAQDEFLALIERVLEHDPVIFATPVYWYSMSGSMKTFFDRITDLTRMRKDLGRRLAGKSVLLVATGSDAELPPGFAVPFELTAAYLNMPFGGAFYYSDKTPLPESVATQRPRFVAALTKPNPNNS
ncbi:flavodoxin family protein [Hymenobacter lucidus]|uniref:NAD(P)H-dependent oxidoreductase n=1 Tax=Hymenobacter lucidus TaxID=2880930 RepID=A0ABS8AN14_9BACT|nr:NAD(P)H-dependent oxidoreductase [Hymenobacter lucidus]MCB2407557.1 NAD(P)H-dependent oxidoreductase [Hymenobacter lucidus]